MRSWLPVVRIPDNPETKHFFRWIWIFLQILTIIIAALLMLAYLRYRLKDRLDPIAIPWEKYAAPRLIKT